MTTFKALKRLMLSLRKEAQPVKMDGAAESEEIYVTSGLKGRNNRHRIKVLAEGLCVGA
ncbi:MAG: hypothetical protein AOA65_0954 [Candidatus Bathyarchaeota archaeon BA1]|nr:MAG: hypothetical protein AOA65_0954 [Candidatus Bathyarchaeota archaeon BA1]